MTEKSDLIAALEKLRKQYKNPGMALPKPTEYDRGNDDLLDKAISLAREMLPESPTKCFYCAWSEGHAVDCVRPKNTTTPQDVATDAIGIKTGIQQVSAIPVATQGEAGLNLSLRDRITLTEAAIASNEAIAAINMGAVPSGWTCHDCCVNPCICEIYPTPSAGTIIHQNPRPGSACPSVFGKGDVQKKPESMHNEDDMYRKTNNSIHVHGGLLDPDMPAQKLRLHMGELTEQEERTARAVIRWANAQRGEISDNEGKNNAYLVKKMVEACAGLEDLEDCMLAALVAIRPFLRGGPVSLEKCAREIMRTHRDTDCNEWGKASVSWKRECKEVAKAVLQAAGVPHDGN